MIACLSGAMVLDAIYGVPANPLTFDKITLPHDIQMQQTDTTTLTPIGKMKGEIDGDFEAFYLAVDKMARCTSIVIRIIRKIDMTNPEAGSW